jgi:hypothetical protein
MQSRRRFQPSMESLSVRISPTGMGMLGGSPLAAHAAIAGVSGTMTPMDTDSPQTGNQGPVIVGEPTPPPGQNC